MNITINNLLKDLDEDVVKKLLSLYTEEDIAKANECLEKYYEDFTNTTLSLYKNEAPQKKQSNLLTFIKKSKQKQNSVLLKKKK